MDRFLPGPAASDGSLAPAVTGPSTRAPDPGGLLAELGWRGSLQDRTPGLEARLATGGPIAAYNGFDPTGPSLHVGHLVPIFGLLHAPAPRRPAGRGRRRRDGDDRRSVRHDRPSATSSTATRSPRTWPSIRAQLERFLDFEPGRGAARVVNNLDWLGRYAHARLPARRRQALHDPVHAGQGFGPAPARRRAVVHRVQLHAPPGGRLPAPVPDAGGRAPDRRRRPVGQHHRRPRAHPPDVDGRRGGGTSAPTRCATRCCSTRAGSQVRQDRRAARPSGSTRPGPRPYAFYQFLARPPTTSTSAGCCGCSRCSTGPTIEGLEADAGGRTPSARPAQRALALDLTTRVHGWRGRRARR